MLERGPYYTKAILKGRKKNSRKKVYQYYLLPVFGHCQRKDAGPDVRVVYQMQVKILILHWLLVWLPAFVFYTVNSKYAFTVLSIPYFKNKYGEKLKSSPSNLCLLPLSKALVIY